MRLGRWGQIGLQFMGFFLLALFIWSAIESEQRAIVQRAIEVPLSVTGLGPSRVATGVPDSVVVIVSGISTNVERLRPEYFDAFIDLRDVSAEFDVAVRTIAPQGIEVLDVTPGRIIGITEALDSRTVPLRLLLANAGPALDGLRLGSQPREVTVSGQETQTARVSYVTAVVEGAEAGESQTVSNLFAVDENGVPVREVRIMPTEVLVMAEREPLLYSRRLPVDFVMADPAPLLVTDMALSQNDLLVAGPREAVLPLERIELRAAPPAEAGRHSLAASAVLPEGVTPLETLTVEVTLEESQAGAAAGSPTANQEDEGQEDENQVQRAVP